MFGADSFEKREAFLVLTSVPYVSAVSIYTVSSGDLIPPAFKLNRTLVVALG